jgi:cell division protein FtsB
LRRGNNLRPLAVVLYAAFIGLLLASYLGPLQQIIDGRSQAATLEQKIEDTRAGNDAMVRRSQELQTDAGIERAARNDYGMIGPNEEVYLVPEHMKSGGDGGG